MAMSIRLTLLQVAFHCLAKHWIWPNYFACTRYLSWQKWELFLSHKLILSKRNCKTYGWIVAASSTAAEAGDDNEKDKAHEVDGHHTCTQLSKCGYFTNSLSIIIIRRVVIVGIQDTVWIIATKQKEETRLSAGCYSPLVAIKEVHSYPVIK